MSQSQAGRSQTGTRHTDIDRVFRGKNAHAASAGNPDTILRQQRLVLIDLAREVVDERPNLFFETVIDLVLKTADAKHVRGQARTAIIFEDLQNFFALAKAVQKDRHCADIEGVRGQPEQVAADTVQLGHDDTYVLSTRRRLDFEHFLDGFAVAETIRNRRNVVHPVQGRKELAVGLVLAQLFDATMQITDHAFGVQNTLTVELELDLQHAVSGGMLRPHADRNFAGIE